MITEIPVNEGAKRILNTLKDELFPLSNQLKELLLKIQRLRIKFPIYSKSLNDLELEYFALSEKFFTITQKLETPDILFVGLEGSQPMIDYFQYEATISKTISETSKYVEIIDKTLDRKNQTIQNFRTLSLAIIAIAISILSMFWSNDRKDSNLKNRHVEFTQSYQHHMMQEDYYFYLR